MLTILAGAAGSIFEKTEFWVAVSFFLFIGVLLYYKVPSVIGKALDARAERIRTELDEARRLRDEAQALLADYQKKRAAAEEEAKAIVEQARREAEALSSETRRSLDEGLVRRTRIAEEKIARAEAQAVQEVRSIAVDAAVAAAERVLSGKVSAQSGAGLVEQSIRNLKGKLN
jgi:F-type H+-transporting ATPase subunit b